jgi:hypothetical protein
LIGDAVVFTRVSFGFPLPEEAGLLIPPTAARVHVNTTPAVPLVGLYENNVLLQIAGGVNELVSVGLGLTTTTTF